MVSHTHLLTNPFEREGMFKFTGDSYCMYFLVKLEITLIFYVPESIFSVGNTSYILHNRGGVSEATQLNG